MDVLLGNTGGLQNRLGIFAQELLDFRIANERRPFRFRRLGRYRNAGEADRASRQAPALGIASVTAEAASTARAEMEG